MTKKTRAKARRALLTLSLVLVVAFAAVGGTIAWLTDETEQIVNTFEATDIEIALTETKQFDGTDLEGDEEWKAQLIPGKPLTKNPVVTVNEENTKVDIYLFVKFEKSVADLEKYLTYTSLLNDSTKTEGNEDQIWHKLSSSTATEEIWYRKVKTTDAVKSWALIDQNTVTVKSSIVKPLEEGETAATDSVVMPENDLTMKYTAYAIQVSGPNGVDFEPAQAWQQLNP